MTKEEIAWVRTTTGCNGILQGSPFITLEGASIRHYRTIGGQPVCYDNDCSPVRRGAIPSCVAILGCQGPTIQSQFKTQSESI
jgi:hypothetical protein